MGGNNKNLRTMSHENIENIYIRIYQSGRKFYSWLRCLNCSLRIYGVFMLVNVVVFSSQKACFSAN